MPRQPLGDRAMTGAERMRRYRQRHRKLPPINGNFDASAVLNVAREREQLEQLWERTIKEIRERIFLLSLIAIYDERAKAHEPAIEELRTRSYDLKTWL
jgi:hypothetical protein